MKQITEKIEELKEIHVEKMHFRVIIDTANRIFEEQRKDLYNIFKKYA